MKNVFDDCDQQNGILTVATNRLSKLLTQTNLKPGKSYVYLLCSLLLVLTSCEKRGTTRAISDACELITKEEVEAVQGSTVQEAMSSGQSDAGFRVSQCFYAAEESNRSVSLVVTQSDPDSRAKGSPKDYWKEIFGHGQEKEGLKDEGDKKEEAKSSQKISGVGDDAYWVGSSVARALYVLKTNVFIRISVGGPDDEGAKLDKSKALAEKALQRLVK